MASESQEDLALGVDVSAGLSDWLDEQAASMGVERAELVAQILASYHAAATLDGELDATQLLDLDADDFVDVEAAVEEAVDERVAELVDERVAAAVDRRIDERIDDLADDISDHVRTEVAADRRTGLDELESEFQTKIEDVRERVVQVKREADAKAPAVHTHDELQAVDALDERVTDLADDLTRLRDEVDDHETTELAERVDDATEKLNRVAWVVSDLKDDATGRDSHEQAVDRIKRAAAQEGVSTASCEQCDETVHVGLLTDPECPHCRATVSDVRPAGGFLRKKARLAAASQLESGEGSERP